MSFQAMTWAVEQACDSPGEKLVLVMLANCCNGHSGRCNPSHKRLAAECSMGVSTLKRHLAALAERGLLRIIAISQDGVSLPNQYDLSLEGVGPNRADGSVQSGPGVGPNRATNQESNQEYNQHPLPPGGGGDGDLLRSEADSAAKPMRKVAELETTKFAEFYQAYPRHEARPDAAKAWRKNNCEAMADRIIAEVKARATQDSQWAKERKRFVPLPATYLNGRRWEDQWRDGGTGGTAGLPDFMQGVR